MKKTLAALAALTPGANRKELAKSVSNWVMTDVLRVVSEKKITIGGFPVAPTNLAAMIGLIQDGTISGKIAKEVFEEMLTSREHPKTIIDGKGLLQVSDAKLIRQAVERVLAANKAQVEKYMKGGEKVFGFFVGETMKLMKGKANPKVVNDILKQQLNSLKG